MHGQPRGAGAPWAAARTAAGDTTEVPPVIFYAGQAIPTRSG